MAENNANKQTLGNTAYWTAAVRALAGRAAVGALQPADAVHDQRAGLAGDPATYLAQVPRAQGGATRGGAANLDRAGIGGGGRAVVIPMFLQENVGAGV